VSTLEDPSPTHPHTSCLRHRHPFTAHAHRMGAKHSQQNSAEMVQKQPQQQGSWRHTRSGYDADDEANASDHHSRRRCECTPRIKSHVLEWILIIIVILVPLGCAYFLIPFRNRAISLLDPNIQQPYRQNDTLPIIPVILPSVFIPIICFFLYPFILSRCSRRMGLPHHPYSFHYTYWWTSILVQSVGLTVLLSELSKRLVQSPRPDFLGRCFPQGVPADIFAQAKASNFIIDTDSCQPTSKATFEDGFQSMPSEHTVRDAAERN
jgi:hypothetical protein